LASSRTFNCCALALSLLSAAKLAAAQEDLTLPPRIVDAPPSAARLAPPPEPAREAAIEEVLVVRENPWRLPDLGSEWRAQHEDIPEPGRITASFFPLYDPEAEVPMYNLFPVNRELMRPGFIEIFRVRFGRR